MNPKSATWQDVPADTLVRLLGPCGQGFHPRDIVKPRVLVERYGVPLELLPVKELVANDAPAGTVLFDDDGRRVFAMQGIVFGDLIDAIAKGLGVRVPADAPTGYAGSRFALAEAIVQHVDGCGEGETLGGAA